MKIMAVSMLKKVIIVLIILILVSTTGCTLPDPREDPSYSVFPKMILDYDIEQEQIRVWVKSAIGDFKYDYIKIEISSVNYTKTVEENNTYSTQLSSEVNDFNLTLFVTTEERFNPLCYY
jgi:hypothetical protein